MPHLKLLHRPASSSGNRLHRGRVHGNMSTRAGLFRVRRRKYRKQVLEELKDFDPYYTNTFYAFDVDFESLKKNNIKHYICFSEAVAYDTANRMIYAGIDRNDISILPNDSDEAILKELDKFDVDNVYLITWLKKYHELEKSTKQYGGNE